MSGKTFDRVIIVNVLDADRHVVEGATIEWTKNGVPYGKIEHSNGHGTLTLKDRRAIIGVTATFEGRTETRTLAIDQPGCDIEFADLHLQPTPQPEPKPEPLIRKHFAALVGIMFVLIAIALAFTFSKPNVLQTRIILAVLSLGGGAFAQEIPGLLKVDMDFGKRLAISAAGALGIFVILYLVIPAT